jgi:hypothetical protein
MPFSLEAEVLLEYNTGMLEFYETDDRTKILQLLIQQQEKWQAKYEVL